MKLRMGTRAEWRAWFGRGGLWWVSFALTALGVLGWLLLPHTQDTVRRLGLIYEVVGILVVVVEIRKTSSRHNRDPLSTRFRRYWRELPLLPRHVTLAVSSSTMTVSGSSGVFLGVARAGTPTVDQRLHALEQRAEALESGQATTRRSIETEVTERKAAFKDEAEKRQAAFADLDRKIVDVETGGLDLSLFGVSWLLVGVLMTTGTPELCLWVLRCQ